MAETAALVERDVVLATGADAAGYLQGQVSQDVESIAPGFSAWSLVLAPQGKVDAWFRLTRRRDGAFLMDVDAGFGTALTARLERFRLRVDAVFAPLPGWRMLSLRGVRADDARPGSVDAAVRAEVAWPGFEGVDLLGPSLDPPPGMAAAGADGWDAARIRAGWPAMGRELTERTIPAEVPGLVESSVSFTKGCYVGQELVARIDSRGGHVPRPVRLLEIQCDDEVPAGTEVLVGHKAVGKVTSAAFDEAAAATVALAPVHRNISPPAAATVAGHPAQILSTAATRPAH